MRKTDNINEENNTCKDCNYYRVRMFADGKHRYYCFKTGKTTKAKLPACEKFNNLQFVIQAIID
jgi:hypothetical protein